MAQARTHAGLYRGEPCEQAFELGALRWFDCSLENGG